MLKKEKITKGIKVDKLGNESLAGNVLSYAHLLRTV